MTVLIENIYNTQYGNANVVDADGNKYVIYGLILLFLLVLALHGLGDVAKEAMGLIK